MNRVGRACRPTENLQAGSPFKQDLIDRCCTAMQQDNADAGLSLP